VFAPNQYRKKLFTEPDELGQPLHYAALLGLEHVLTMLAPPGCDDVDCVTESGSTPLIWASSYVKVSSIKALIVRGANVDAQTRGGRCALHEVAKKSGLLGVHHLVRAGATIDLPDCDGWTSCYYACEGNNIEVAKYLLQDKSDPKIAALLDEVLPAPFDTPLSKIRKADPGYRTNSGGSALHQVSGWGYVDVVALLLKHGAPVNIATAYGRTPLHQAAGGGAKQVVKMLLDAGADVHATDLSGYTARDMAEDGGHIELSEMLMEIEEKTPRPKPYYGEDDELASEIGEEVLEDRAGELLVSGT
jgi:ankyrin repeat protein